ncbi:hypothetical protein BpHYR1_021608, partial [Brachionus plicatilis]
RANHLFVKFIESKSKQEFIAKEIHAYVQTVSHSDPKRFKSD